VHLTAPIEVSTGRQKRLPAPLPASTSAHLRMHFPAEEFCYAGRVGQWTRLRHLIAADNALGAPLPVIGAGMPVFFALEVSGGSYDGTSHDVAGDGQERQTQQRGDQQGDT